MPNPQIALTGAQTDAIKEIYQRTNAGEMMVVVDTINGNTLKALEDRDFIVTDNKDDSVWANITGRGKAWVQRNGAPRVMPDADDRQIRPYPGKVGQEKPNDCTECNGCDHRAVLDELRQQSQKIDQLVGHMLKARQLLKEISE